MAPCRGVRPGGSPSSFRVPLPVQPPSLRWWCTPRITHNDGGADPFWPSGFRRPALRSIPSSTPKDSCLQTSVGPILAGGKFVPRRDGSQQTSIAMPLLVPPTPRRDNTDLSVAFFIARSTAVSPEGSSTPIHLRRKVQRFRYSAIHSVNHLSVPLQPTRRPGWIGPALSPVARSIES